MSLHYGPPMPDPLTDPGNSLARRREILVERLAASRAELAKRRSGLVEVVFDAGLAQVPVDPRLRVDPDAAGERAFLIAAAAVGALVQAGGGELAAGGAEHLLLVADGADCELAAVALSCRTVDALRMKMPEPSGFNRRWTR